MENANAVLKLKDQVFGAGIPKICVPVTEPDAVGIVRELKRCAALPCSVVEWRADRFAEFRDARRTGQILMKAAAVFEDIAPEKLLLFTVRTASDGGEEVDR
ncbi:MAG: type I 3-dehydroquinate dehydratase, partial [Lachnospiraceae bacterium]|nr:type I 3-dehydroquinate dehydratase [Lachnospiraceae bacterium]